MIEFEYKEWLKKIGERGELFIIKRPNAIVTIMHKDNFQTLDMVVDSGSDICIIPKIVGESLGLEIESEKEIISIGGIGGSIPIVERELILKIGTEKFKANVGWALEEGVVPLLGREDVFDMFHIEFLQDKELVRFHSIK